MASAHPVAVTERQLPVRDSLITLHGKNLIAIRTLSTRAAIEHDSSVQGIALGQTGGEPTAAGESGVLKWFVRVD